MVKDTLIKEEESSSGLYYSLLVIGVVIFSMIFFIVTVFSGSANLAEKPWYIFLSFSVSPLAIIAVTLCFSYLKKESILQTFGWHKTGVKYYVIALIAFVSVFFGLSNINLLFVEFLTEHFGYVASEITLPDFSVINYLLVIITICVLPAVAEEIAMRGVILNGIKSGSVLLNAVIGGLLFSLYHMTPMQTPYQFVVGFTFSLIAIKSRSTLPTTITHFLNNFAIVTIEYFCPWLFAVQGGWMLAITIPATICLVGVIVLLMLDSKKQENSQKGSLKNFFLGASVGICICAIMWISAFFG